MKFKKIWVGIGESEYLGQSAPIGIVYALFSTMAYARTYPLDIFLNLSEQFCHPSLMNPTTALYTEPLTIDQFGHKIYPKKRKGMGYKLLFGFFQFFYFT